MTPKATLYTLALSILLVIGGTWAYRHHAQSVADAQTIEATRLGGERDAAIAQSKAKDQEIAAHAKTIADLQADVLRAKAVAAKIRAGKGSSALPSIPQPSVSDAGPSDPGSLGALVSSLDAVIATQDRLIAEQAEQIKTQAERIITGDQALKASMLQTRALELALDAQRHATQSSKWVGRFQGLALGLAGGFIGGKL